MVTIFRQLLDRLISTAHYKDQNLGPNSFYNCMNNRLIIIDQHVYINFCTNWTRSFKFCTLTQLPCFCEIVLMNFQIVNV